MLAFDQLPTGKCFAIAFAVEVQAVPSQAMKT
jgi:hypothetical protein